jgi:phosphatidylserine/phosphatidylglycerophosphate/cardiolipin synthase-like enzyme
VNEVGGMEVRKPDGSIGMVDFAFLAKNAPEPFKSEWTGGQGINIHHKFVVTDFSLPTATVFTGSSNLSPSGETGNGDHLIKIEDSRVATSYAIEAVRVFDHLHFRTLMKEVFGDKKKASKKAGTKGTVKQPDKLVLQKPTAISGKKNTWFDRFYVVGSQLESDRKLFSK